MYPSLLSCLLRAEAHGSLSQSLTSDHYLQKFGEDRSKIRVYEANVFTEKVNHPKLAYTTHSWCWHSTSNSNTATLMSACALTAAI